MDEKSNDITAIPKLTEILVLKRAIITIDVMGRQTEIAQKIIDVGDHYALNVKRNQPTLRDGVEPVFSDFLEGSLPSQPVRRYSTACKAHGRKESRGCYVCPPTGNFPDRDRWPKRKAIGTVISNTERDDKDCVDVRSTILSKVLPAKKFAALVVSHWAIVNNIHWQFDVAFQEDPLSHPQGERRREFSGLRRTALAMLKNEKTRKIAIKINGFQQAGTMSTCSKCFSGYSLWCNRPDGELCRVS